MERQVIKIGTRKSKLAMWQANYVADLLDSEFAREVEKGLPRWPTY